MDIWVIEGIAPRITANGSGLVDELRFRSLMFWNWRVLPVDWLRYASQLRDLANLLHDDVNANELQTYIDRHLDNLKDVRKVTALLLIDHIDD